MVDDGSGSHGLARARRALNQTDRFLKHAFDRIHLGVIELGESRGGKSLRHLRSERLRFKLVSKEFVILQIRQSTKEMEGQK